MTHISNIITDAVILNMSYYCLFLADTCRPSQKDAISHCLPLVLMNQNKTVNAMDNYDQYRL